MNKFSIILIIFMAAAFNLKSQDKIKKDSIVDHGSYPKILVKFAPLAMLDLLEMSFQPSVELQFKNNIAWLGEVNLYFPGVVTNSADEDDKNPYAGEYRTGYKIKNQIRFYFGDEYSSHDTYEGTYFAMEHFYKKLDTHISEILNSNTENYQKVCDLILRKKVNAFHMVIGQQSSISKKLPFGIDVYAGLGVRYKDVSIVDIPDGFTYKGYDGPFWGDSKGKRLVPSITAGFRFSYTINY